MKKLPMNKGRGEMQVVVSPNGVQCKRYVGKFSVPALQAKADTGMWYTVVPGNPFPKEGEGRTPQAACEDAISRTISEIDNMKRGNKSLEGATFDHEELQPVSPTNV